MSRYDLIEADSIKDLWKQVVIGNKFAGYRDLTIVLKWNPEEYNQDIVMRPGKAAKRITKYLIPEENRRFGKNLKTKTSCTIRFGLDKGNSRADFCLIGGCYNVKSREFHLFYRGVELTMELYYDLAFIERELFKAHGVLPRRIIITAAQAMVSTRSGRRKYFDKLLALMKE